MFLDFDAGDARAIGSEEEERGDVERADAVARSRLTLDDLAGERGDDQAFVDFTFSQRASCFGTGRRGAGDFLLATQKKVRSPVNDEKQRWIRV